VTIYTDGVHVVSDKGLHELHEFAGSHGIRRRMFHTGSRHAHYDLPKAMRGRYVPDAKAVTSRDIVRVLRGVHQVVEEDGGEEPTGRRARARKCGFCGVHVPSGEGRYIYPVPDSERIWWDGKLACVACAPPILVKQIELGLVIPVGR